jgi:hypothetical protein
MLGTQWDAELAVTYGPLDEELEGQPTIDRYGITVDQELAGEPLAVALAQEEPDPVTGNVDDDPWAFVDVQWDGDDPLYSPSGDRGPEITAMHLVPL